MDVPRRRAAVLVAVLAMLPLGLGACGLGGDDGDGAPVIPEDGPEKSRAVVQAYLDAMTTKDVAAGRGQLCVPMQAAFDQAATGPNGDFADHFKVTEATITDVRPNGGQLEVSTSISALAGNGAATPAELLFTVAKAEAGWCIANETVAGASAAGPSPSAGGTTS
ncbi:hypothetical protein OG792_24240 [Micromonospora sp. NBC_01699]|uniref:hypothetical protein n=1 Tax=Micromonospora sp. NBC_01699 TaxID=2975984 RepID=UPI002E2ADC29|nr:hypothetical protein [Micromonospora sp. NBC_01699]